MRRVLSILSKLLLFATFVSAGAFGQTCSFVGQVMTPAPTVTASPGIATVGISYQPNCQIMLASLDADLGYSGAPGQISILVFDTGSSNTCDSTTGGTLIYDRLLYVDSSTQVASLAKQWPVLVNGSMGETNGTGGGAIGTYYNSGTGAWTSAGAEGNLLAGPVTSKGGALCIHFSAALGAQFLNVTAVRTQQNSGR